MPCAAEVIRRHSGYNNRLAVFVQLELFRVGPNIGRILGHKDRQVTDDSDTAIVSVSLQREPLAKEEKLVEHVRLNFFSHLFARSLDRRRCTAHQRGFPLVPRDAPMSIFQRAKESRVFEPVCVLLGKRLESTAQRRAGGLRVAYVSSTQQLLFELMCCTKVDPARDNW